VEPRNETHDHTSSYLHAHGPIDPGLFRTQRAVKAVKYSFIGLVLTASLQTVIVFLSGSVALFADTVHNFADAGTAIPLLIAFRLANRPPTTRFTYGFGRVEDLVGLFIVLLIFASGLFAVIEGVLRLFHPSSISHPGIVAVAALVGFSGNQAVAILRIRAGKEIGSAALVADVHHARSDVLTSLAVLGSAAGSWLGYPIADPIIGIAIGLMILAIGFSSGRVIFARLIDGIDPKTLHQIRHAAENVKGVIEVSEVRDNTACWPSPGCRRCSWAFACPGTDRIPVCFYICLRRDKTGCCGLQQKTEY